MEIELLASGFGGQGVMVIGQFMAAASVKENKYALFYPSYGPAMRGGTANCTVISSDDPIGSPIITAHQNVMVLNLPSFDKFENTIQKDGNFFVNSSLIEKKSERKDIQCIYIPSNEMAIEAGSNLSANIVMLGAFLKVTQFAKKETLEQVIKEKFERKGEKIVSINLKALEKGYNFE